MQQAFLSKMKRERRNKRLRLKIGLAILAGIILFAAIFYLFDKTNFFQIKSIKVIGLTSASADELKSELEKKTSESLLGNILGTLNYLAWREDDSINRFPYASVSIEKNFLSREVVISVTERERFGIWCRDTAEAIGCWWFDKDKGLILEKALDSEGQLIIKVYESENSEPLEIGMAVLEPQLFANAKKVIAYLQGLEIPFGKITVNKKRQEISVSAKGAKVIFSLRFDPNLSAIPALEKIINERPLASLEYVDLTVESKVYLKNK